MKKFYVVVFVLLCLDTISYAQPFTGGVFRTKRLVNAPVSDPNTWVGSVGPGTDCYNCQVIIDGTIIDDEALAVINNSQILITGGSSLSVNQYLQLFDTEIIVGGSDSLIVNDEIDLYGTSTVRLANTNSFVDGNNAIDNPPHGPIADGTVHPEIGSGTGIFYITNWSGTPPLTAVPIDFDMVLTQFVGAGKSDGSSGFMQYTINCGGSFPNACAYGKVWGPAVTQNPGGTFPFDQFIVATPLPVVLAQFVASRNSDQSIKLAWKTTSEINSGYFNIERSPDANSWQTIGTVNAKGFSSIAVDYTYTDANPLSGTNYYRLKMVDLDGKFKYSKVLSISANETAEALVVYNNPFTDQIRVKVNIHSADNLILTVTDMVGKTYFRQSFDAHSGDNFININPSGASSGIYMLHIQGRSYDKTVKLLKQ